MAIEPPLSHLEPVIQPETWMWRREWYSWLLRLTGFVSSLGDVIEASAGPISLTSAADASVATISLPAGEWSVWGTIQFNPTGGTVNFSQLRATVNTSGVTPSFPNGGAYSLVAAASSSQNVVPVGSRTYKLTATTTIHLVGAATWSGGGTAQASGYIGAKRIGG